MSSDVFKERSISYINKDFQSFKRNLIKFTQAHHSGVFTDFNETSPGMAMLEQVAYVGHVLSFYIDEQFNELKQETVKEMKNAVSFAKSRGYKVSGKRAARGSTAMLLEIPAIENIRGETVPNDLYLPRLIKSAKLEGPQGIIFETLDDVNYSSSLNRAVTGSRFDSNTGQPTHFAVRKTVDITAGETKEDVFTISEFQQFRQLELENEDVIEIISATDSDGNEWTEVDFLPQEAVFDNEVNTDDDEVIVPYVLKYVTVPRRFITDRNSETNKTSLIFGSGDGINFDDELVPNLADFALPLAGRKTFSAISLDPQNFLKTRTLGLSPFNTTITVKYRVGGGKETTVQAGSIDNVVEAIFDFSTNNLDATLKSNVESSIQTVNLVATSGGGEEESIRDININAGAYFAAQNRVVTKEDVMARIFTLPEKFGKPEKVFVKRNNNSSLALDIHLLAKDDNGNLIQATDNLKSNIKTYLTPFRMMGDTFNLLNTNIINLVCNFGIVVSSRFNRSETLIKCIDVIRDFLNIDLLQIGQPIVLSKLQADIQEVVGVISVFELRFSNIIGANNGFQYSNTRFDVQGNTSNNIIYCPEDSIFEVKFPRRNIVGVAK